MNCSMMNLDNIERETLHVHFVVKVWPVILCILSHKRNANTAANRKAIKQSYCSLYAHTVYAKTENMVIRKSLK